MDKQRIRVVNTKNMQDGRIGTECYINDHKVNEVRSVNFHASCDEIPVVQFETMGMPEIDMPGDVKFSFAPKTIQEAAIVLRNEFMSNLESRQALISSIMSALKEMPEEIEMQKVAELIANRIVGSEK